MQLLQESEVEDKLESLRARCWADPSREQFVFLACLEML